MRSDPALALDNVSFSYSNGPVLEDVSLAVARGEMTALLGPNGSGKTTLIKLAAGVLRPRRGTVMLGKADLRWLGRKASARRIAVVPQLFHLPFAFTVAEVAMLGRTPFLKPFSEEKREDREAVQSSLEMTGAAGLAGRYFNELSGGERQKVVLAMALAQQPEVLLLDEPTAHLDINHQVEILTLLQRLNRERGITIVAAMHDLNLASLYFQRLVLLKDRHIVAGGPPADILTPKLIEEVFAARVWVQPHPVSSGVPYVIMLPPGNGHNPIAPA